jgi:hypothetical protein
MEKQDEKQAEKDFPKWFRFMFILFGFIYPKKSVRLAAVQAWNNNFGYICKMTEKDVN